MSDSANIVKQSLKDYSRTSWTATVQRDDKNPGAYPGDKNVEIGCMQRVAEALEKMADPYIEHLNTIDRLKSIIQAKEDFISSQKGIIAGLRRTNTLLNKKLTDAKG